MESRPIFLFLIAMITVLPQGYKYFGFSKHQDQRLRVVLPDKALPLLYQTVHYLPTSLLCVSVKKVIPPLTCNAHSHF